MESYKKGYCFSGQDGDKYLITGDAVLKSSGEVCYLVQELSGDLRLLVFTEEEIRQADSQGMAGSVTNAGDHTVKEPDHRASYNRMTSSSYQDSYRDSVRKHEEVEAESDDKLQAMMIAFLETDSNAEKLNYLMRMKNRVTESMLDSMTISLDMEPVKGSRMEKYQSLENYLKLRRRYEGSRRFR